MHTFRQVFCNPTVTPAAHLRRVSRIDQPHFRTSFCSFVRQYALEHPKPGVVGAQGEPVIAQHKLQVQVFLRGQSGHRC